ncbi:hypothetical protein CY34DRAFT_113862 [Suillus luteus UH-Slu-Lm8-n1]|uniref:Uncharacterized protein n=1 Tax=Suillus luteus UH-Slu-Lm8-n1 TaxID=930992 RepID=A0A0D0B609_9AGAM|nr:hypothetical protein CY34DRAFT_113862 [Suillus luteus UH-Slu-Lm8-n1]
MCYCLMLRLGPTLHPSALDLLETSGSKTCSDFLALPDPAIPRRTLPLALAGIFRVHWTGCDTFTPIATVTVNPNRIRILWNEKSCLYCVL